MSEEIEKAFLLAEYVALREEILSRTGRQTQITTLSVGILGALLAVIPIKVFSASQTIPVNDLNNPLVITALLIVSGLFTSLLWVFMEQEMRVTNAAYYIHNSIRVRAALLLKFSKNDNNELVWDKELGILNWDKYLIQTSQPEDVVSWLIFLIRVFSRYVVMAIPALIALFAALLIYVSKPPFHKEVIINVINQVFFFLRFIILYKCCIICCIVYEEATI